MLNRLCSNFPYLGMTGKSDIVYIRIVPYWYSLESERFQDKYGDGILQVDDATTVLS